ncbi:MAG: hypothetical protein II157_01510, partial [Bacteroidales bacterium]|nr:hypothetical protein [Bacteroidales bacterium]
GGQRGVQGRLDGVGSAVILGLEEVHQRLGLGAGGAGLAVERVLDAKTFEVRARPVSPIPNLRAGMSAIVK